MKGYWIVLGSEVVDPAAQQSYGKLWAPIAAKYQATVKVLDMATVLLESNGTHRVVVVEFPSYELAKTCYADPDYEEAKQFALKASKRALLLMEGEL